MSRRNSDTRVRALYLAIVQDGLVLTVSLSDLRSLAIVEQARPWGDRFTDPLAAASAGASAHETAMAFAARIGRTIFELLPARTAAALRDSVARDLDLQLSESLAGIPWELAFDGTNFLGAKFNLTRHVVAADTPDAAREWPAADDACKVLVLGSHADSPELRAHVNRITRLIDGHGRFSIVYPASGERVGQRLGALLAGADIVHCIGGSQAVLESAARLAQPPRLVICESHVPAMTLARLCTTASDTGLNVLVRQLDTSESGADFTAELYRRLGAGEGIARAMQGARTRSLERATGFLHHELAAVCCGDGSLAVLSQAHSSPQDNNLRQATIMAYDLVNSTQLMGHLGAERYSELLSSYHRACAKIVRRHGGVTDDPQGDDGVMSYFGVPFADEDASAQCLRTALAIVDAVRELGVSVRIGISTGRVVIRDGQPVGVDVHLAARLQSIAAPGCVVVGEATHRLTAAQFEFEPLDTVPRLKGFDAPVAAYRVVRELRASDADPFDTALCLTPFVGREHEAEQLEMQWQAACNGAGRALLLSGDAGIGKSRLAREFRLSLEARGHLCIELRCAPHHASSAFYPLIGWLSRALDIRELDSNAAKLDKIARSPASRAGVPDATDIVASLLSVAPDGPSRTSGHSAERQRQLTLDVLLGWVEREAGVAPLCLIVEDVQWLDPSTREFLDRLSARMRGLPVFMLLTQRTETQASFEPGFKIHELALRGLPAEAARLMVISACGQQTLPPETVRFLATRADGVPLFIEESTRMAVEGISADTEHDASWLIRQTVPATIQDLLMARLDRLAPAKQVAQVGATIGREFSNALIAAVLDHEHAGHSPEALEEKLDLLVRSGLIVAKGSGPQAGYAFKHALVRDAAYQSLLERDRERLHRAIAHVVRDKFAEFEQSQPELLAYHFTEAGQTADAVTYWEKAARRAALRSAHHEAITHLTNGLALTQKLESASLRGRAELRMQLLLAGRLIATDGYGADRVERVYARAETLCRELGDEDALMKVQLGLEGYHFMRADFDKAHAIALEAATIIERSADPMRKIQSVWAIANILFHQGEVLDAVEHMDSCLRDYDRMQHRPSAVQDPGVMCLCYSAWGKWELGFPDEALRRARQVVALADKLDHRFSMGEAWGFITTVHYFRGEYEQALVCANRAIDICEDGGFAVWLAHAKVMRGRLVAELAHGPEDIARGIAEMRQAYCEWASTGAVVTQAFYLAMQAEGLALAGRPQEGLAVLDIAFGIVQRVKERYYEPEIRRLIGELTLQLAAQNKEDRSTQAQEWFEGALRLARAEHLRSLSLRAAISLGALWITQGRRAEALALLAKERAPFTEGLATRDLVRVGQMMEALSSVDDYRSMA